MSTPIDLWDPATFDDGLVRILTAATGLMDNYFDATERERRERKAWDLRGAALENDFAGEFLEFKDELALLIADRIIRGWHYSRLTDEEVAAFRRLGIQPASLATIRARLGAQVAAGRLMPEAAAALFAASPFRSEQHDARAGRFWVTSSPLPIDDPGVQPLLAAWGGEGVTFGFRDETLRATLAMIGRPRVMEVAVPLAATNQTYGAACVIASTYARTRGHAAELSSIDVCATRPLGAEAILAVHTEGDEAFAEIDLGYPDGP